MASGRTGRARDAYAVMGKRARLGRQTSGSSLTVNTSSKYPRLLRIKLLVELCCCCNGFSDITFSFWSFVYMLDMQSGGPLTGTQIKKNIRGRGRDEKIRENICVWEAVKMCRSFPISTHCVSRRSCTDVEAVKLR